MTETVDAFAGRMAQMSGRLQALMRAESGAAAGEAQERSRTLARTRLRTVTGRLLGSITAKPTDDGFAQRATARSARIQDEGGTILPTRGPFLAVPVPGGGLRLVRRVRLRPTHFLRDGFEGARAALVARLESRVNALLEGGAGVQ